MNDYTPMRGDILTKNGEKLLIHLVTKTRVVFKLRYLGEDKGTFFKPHDVFLAEVRSAQPKLERPAQEQAA